jgi:DNA-nicking Smr family endonuclease
MAKRKRKRRSRERGAPDPAPALTGTAQLLVEMPVETLDLHGMTAEEAKRRLGFFFDRHRFTSSGHVVHVITGKGAGSPGRAVLPGLVRDLLGEEFADVVTEFAGLPGGGGYAVRIAEG